jgi:hypothetical protein
MENIGVRQKQLVEHTNTKIESTLTCILSITNNLNFRLPRISQIAKPCLRSDLGPGRFFDDVDDLPRLLQLHRRAFPRGHRRPDEMHLRKRLVKGQRSKIKGQRLKIKQPKRFLILETVCG